MADADWGSIFPKPDDGFIRLGPKGRLFILALYHQLHCLDVMRVSFVLNGTNAAHHVEHCLRYLRLALLCQADTTLEETALTPQPDGSEKAGASGVGMVHRCKDWSVLRRWMEENSQPDSE